MSRLVRFKRQPLAVAILVNLHFASLAYAAEPFFSEYAEGSSNNKALEIFNPGPNPFDLTGCQVKMYFNGATLAGRTHTFASGTIAVGDVFVLTNPSAVNTTLLAASDDVTSDNTWFNGDDAVELVCGGVSKDVIGQIGLDPGAEWGSGFVSTADNSVRRKVAVCAGDVNGANTFDPTAEWDGFAMDTFDGLGSHSSSCLGDIAPVVSNTTPASGATSIATSANVVVTFSETVTAPGSSFNIACTTSGTHPITLNSGANTIFTLNPDADFQSGETCTVTVTAAGVVDVDGVPNNLAADYAFTFSTGTGFGLTPIYNIQGSGATSPLVGQTKTTSGVVTRINNNGFYLQDPAGDGNSATSDGIFVFTSSAPTVLVGQAIQVTGTVAEFNTGAASNADTLGHTVTELTSPTGITLQSSGNTITPTPVTLPEAVNDDLEHHEGMLVIVNGPLTADQNYFLGRYGQLTLSAGGRLETPTNKYRPNTSSAVALADENARRRIILDDGTSVQNPDPTPYIGLDNTLRAGDTVGSITGVIDFGLATNDNTKFGDYKIHPTQTVTFTRAHPRTATPSVVGGNIKVASFNVLNYFTTFTDGATATGQSGQGCSLDGAVSAANCRGADSITEFTRQRNKIIPAIQAINADIVGLMEIQNNGNTAAQNLVDGLNAVMGANTYAVLPVPGQGSGTDAIRVAMIYKPASVTLMGSPQSDVDPINNRPTLLQTYAAPNGQRFSVVVNHFKSKSSCPASGVDTDQSDGQGCWNNRRTLQAQRLRTWIAANAATDTLVIGDLNAYGQEDPVFDLTSNGYVDQSGVFESLGYSYVFDGAAGRLDHAITTASLSSKVSGVNHWHINADEPFVIDYNLEFKKPACSTCGTDYYAANAYRSSDHDPVVVGLNLNDIDGDGLSDSMEILLGTSSQDRDSDDDGIADGSEDANHNGIVDSGETNPNSADTDGDGLQDGTESGLTVGVPDPDGAGSLLGTNVLLFVVDSDPTTFTSATHSDTDGDGLTDGAEDLNHNGRIDAGEGDPNNAAATSAQVPTMGFWQMLILGSLLGKIGVFATRRLQTVHPAHKGFNNPAPRK